MNQMRDPEKTKKAILESALQEIHRKGFTGASVNDILKATGLTRGALYHHFPTKKDLGLAVMEMISQDMAQMWLAPLEQCQDPINCLQQILRQARQTLKEQDIILGCPLNNLAQEMSPQDDDFRIRLAAMYNRWRQGVAQALERGQAAGVVDRAVEAYAAATFFVASLTGCRGLAKTAQSPEILGLCAGTLARWLETLRA
jgi:AcrR family transcriptional regulator